VATWGLPLLDESRCTGCGDCVAVCPTGCLEMAGPLPWLPRPLDCVSCGVCVAVCPAEALTLSPADDPGSPRGGNS
jgi:formate hydrogenlyase subunit 6/NADH:ubiquinone oxidoreductase subunit I